MERSGARSGDAGLAAASGCSSCLEFTSHFPPLLPLQPGVHIHPGLGPLSFLLNVPHNLPFPGAALISFMRVWSWPWNQLMGPVSGAWPLSHSPYLSLAPNPTNPQIVGSQSWSWSIRPRPPIVISTISIICRFEVFKKLPFIKHVLPQPAVIVEKLELKGFKWFACDYIARNGRVNIWV